MLSKDKFRYLPWIVALTILIVVSLATFVAIRSWKPRMDENQKVDLITSETAHKSSSFPDASQESIDELTGNDILLRCYDSYSRTKSYECNFIVEGEWKRPGEKIKSRIGGNLKYSYPDRLNIEWQDLRTGDSSYIVYDGKVLRYSPWLSKPSDSLSLLDLLLASDGISNGASIWLPGIVLKTKFLSETIFLPKGQILPAFATHAVIREKSMIDGHECYRVVCERDIATWVFWIDSKEFLLRKLEESATPIQMAAQRKHGGGGYSGEITETRITHIFHNIVRTDSPRQHNSDSSRVR